MALLTAAANIPVGDSTASTSRPGNPPFPFISDEVAVDHDLEEQRDDHDDTSSDLGAEESSPSAAKSEQPESSSWKWTWNPLPDDLWPWIKLLFKIVNYFWGDPRRHYFPEDEDFTAADGPEWIYYQGGQGSQHGIQIFGRCRRRVTSKRLLGLDCVFVFFVFLELLLQYCVKR